MHLETGGSPPGNYFSGETAGRQPAQNAVIPTPEVRLSGLLSQLETDWRIHGDAFEIVMQGLRCVVAIHPADMRTVLTDPNYKDKGPLYRGVRLILGDGILTTSGAEWKTSRRAITPAFHPGQMNAMADTMAAIGENFVQDLRERPDLGRVDLRAEMTALTLDTIMATLFGNRIDPKQDGLLYETVTDAFNLAGSLGGNQAPSEEAQQKYTAVTGSLNAVAQRMIDSARKDEPDGSVLSMLIHSKDETGSYLDDQTIRNELLTLMFAGHETTALTLTWLFKMLENRPDITRRIQQEVQTVLAGQPPGFQDFPKLAYTRQVIDEVLRLRPVVSLIARTAEEKAKIHNFTIEPGDTVVPFIWATHRHPDFWDEPEVFNPDRFSAVNSAGRDRWSYLPFAAGSRICIGKGLALTELTIHTALLMHHFDVKVLPNNVAPEMHITLRPNGPVYAALSPRQTYRNNP
jgi:cytochrome P450